MKEVVDRILKVEQVAHQRIERATQESCELARKAQQEAAGLIERVVTDTLAVAKARAEDANKGFAQEKDKELKLTLDRISAKRIEKEKDISAVSQKIFSRIIQIKE